MNIRIGPSNESKVFSQHGENGVLRMIASILADRISKSFFEFGAHPTESNTLALRADGWSGIMADAQGGEGIIAARVMRENVNVLLGKYFAGVECGVSSIDLDGNDYWIVKAITEICPSIIVVEHNAAFDGEVKVATPYQEPREWTGGCDYGASLNAWVRLLWRKWEARLCYVENSATNAFFVRCDVAQDRIDFSRSLAELMPAPAYYYGDPQGWEWEIVD